MVFFTTIVFGALMPFVVKFFTGKSSESSDENKNDYGNQILEEFEQYEFQRYDKLGSFKYFILNKNKKN